MCKPTITEGRTQKKEGRIHGQTKKAEMYVHYCQEDGWLSTVIDVRSYCKLRYRTIRSSCIKLIIQRFVSECY
jgi:hypothetical protein